MQPQAPGPAQAAAHNPLFSLLELSRRARQGGSAAELRFLLVNDSHALAAYRQAGLWLGDAGLQALSGVVQLEANAPYALWLSRVCEPGTIDFWQDGAFRLHDRLEYRRPTPGEPWTTRTLFP